MALAESKKLTFVRLLIFAALAVGLARGARASSITVTDVVEMNAVGVANILDPVVGPPVPNVSVVSVNGGLSFVNFTGANTAGQIIDGTTVNLVSATHLSSMMSNGSALSAFGPMGGTMVAIASLQGSVINVADMNTTLFTDGKIQIVELSGTFTPTNLTTWNFNGAGGGTVLAEYTLKAPEPIISGFDFDPGGSPLQWAQQFARPVEDVNIFAGNISLGGSVQALFLFEEDDPGQPLLNSTSGLGPLLLSTGFFSAIENETLIMNLAQNITNEGEDVLDTTDRAILNAIAQYGFGADFADFGNGGFDDFLTAGPDYIALTGGNLIPGLQASTVVPEPSSVLAWCLVAAVAVGAGLALKRRRTTSAAAA